MSEITLSHAEVPLVPENLSILARGSSRKGLPATPISREAVVFAAAEILAEVEGRCTESSAEDRSDVLEAGFHRLAGASLLAELSGADRALVELLDRTADQLLARADAFAAEQYRREFALGREDGHA